MRNVLARQSKQGRAIVLRPRRPSIRRLLVGIGRAHHVQPGNCAQSRQLLDGLVGGTVFAHTDAIVREDVKNLQLTQGPEPHRRLHVIGEHEEGRAEGKHPAVRRHAVHRRAHGVLADAECDVAAGVTPHAAHGSLCGRSAKLGRLEIAFALQRRVGGWIQIRRAADDIRNSFGQGIQRLRRRPRASRSAYLRASISAGLRAQLSGSLPAIICSSSAASFGKCFLVCGELLLPFASARARLCPPTCGSRPQRLRANRTCPW